MYRWKVVFKETFIFVLLSVLLIPLTAYSLDYPNGTTTHGVIVNVGTFSEGMTRFVVSGTKGDGQPGSETFWIDASGTEGASHLANVLAAASQGKMVHIWHYGNVEDYGGQTGYWVGVVFVDY